MHCIDSRLGFKSSWDSNLVYLVDQSEMIRIMNSDQQTTVQHCVLRRTSVFYVERPCFTYVLYDSVRT